MAARDTASLLVGLVVLLHTWGAWAKLEVNMEDRVEVFRGNTTQITCMFTSDQDISNISIYWFYVARLDARQLIYHQVANLASVTQDTPFTDRITVNSTGTPGQVVLTVSSVKLEDELEFICRIRSSDEYEEGRTKLKVFETPDRPTIAGVQTVISVNENKPSKIGSCKVKNGYPKPNITWYRNNTPLHAAQDGVKLEYSTTTESSLLLSVTSVLNKKVEKEDKDAKFYCEVSYFVPGGTRMTETSRINITVQYPSTTIDVRVAPPKDKIKEGDSIELNCYGDGNTPLLCSIHKHNETNDSWDTAPAVLNNVTRHNSGVYECTCTDVETADEISGKTVVIVNYLDAPKVKSKHLIVSQGEEVEATCNASSSLDTSTTWFNVTHTNKVEVSKGDTLRLENATFDTAGTYMCVVTVPEIEGMETSGTLLVNVKGPPEIMEKEKTVMEVNFKETVNLKCHVRGFPVPSVTWTTLDGKVLNTTSEKVSEEGIESMASVTVTSDITAFCNASNEYGTQAVAVIFSINTTATTTTTTTPTNTTTNTTTTTSNSSSTAISSTSATEGSGVIIAVLIICILLLAILGSVLYFLYKKGKICGRSGKQNITKEKSNKDNIVVEMKSDNTEEAVLLGVNGEKQPTSDQGGEYLDVQK
uniref:melanoma cell adhesion molecule b isoform X4 n=1 Tax=Monopterus albus TaxID=43700 RepID=UPI0009B467FB|nr:cell surface glycoprotein MUC18 isoform X4 [Monopterus albus]